MKFTNRHKFILFFILFSFSLNAQFGWPFLSNDRGVITGTPGEIRPISGDPNNIKNLRFHGGVDIVRANTAPAGTAYDIYPVTNGIITWNTLANGSSANAAWNSKIWVGDYLYKHVKIDISNLTQGQMVTTNTFIGTMFPVVGSFTARHVHMMATNQSVNYQTLLVPYSDTEAPDFWDYDNTCWVGSQNCNTLQNQRNILQFFTDGIDNDHEPNANNNGNLRKFGGANMPVDVVLNVNGTNVNHTLLFGRVDIMARIRDDRVGVNGGNAGGNCAPHTISYDIMDSNNNNLWQVNNAVDFNTLLNGNFPSSTANPANILFGNNSTCCSALDYIITTNIHGGNTVDRYWNTKLRRNVQETWVQDNTLNSTTGLDAHFMDGRYNVNVEASDIVNSIDYNVPVVIDNFKPYIQHVNMIIGDNTIYDSQWDFDPCGGIKFVNNNPTVEFDMTKLQSEGMTIEVITSEPMNELQIDIPFFNLSNLTATTISTDNQVFTFNTGGISNFISTADLSLHFEGQDFAQNDLLNLSSFITNACTQVPSRNITGWNNPDVIPDAEDITHIIPCLATPDAEVIDVCHVDQYGAIDLEVIAGRTPISYEWSTGATTQDINNLSLGKYTVTITTPDCEIIKKYGIVNEMKKAKIKIIEQQNISSCAGDFDAHDGSIKLGFDANYGPFTFWWSGPNGFNASTQNITGLFSGTYGVTVTNSAGCNFSLSTDLCCCSDEIDDEPHYGDNDYVYCIQEGGNPDLALTSQVLNGVNGNNGSISINVTGGTGNYLFQWTGPNNYESNHQNITHLGVGNYCVTVKDGCNTKTVCFDIEVVSCGDPVTSDFFIETINKPCQGFSDGLISISIPTAPDNTGFVQVDGIDYFCLSEEGNHCFISIGGLSPGQYTVSITGACQWDFLFTLESTPLNLELTGHNETTCYYQRDCKGLSLGSYQEPIVYDYDAATSVPCEAPVYCNNEKVDDIKVDLEKVRLFEFLTYNTIYDGFLQFAGNIGNNIHSNWDLCAKVRFCPLTLRVISHQHPFWLGNFEGSFTDAAGCVHVSCSGILNDFTLCPEDYDAFEDFEDLNLPPLEECVPIQENFLALMLYYDNGYFDNEPNFATSALRDEILHYHDYPQEQIACATITFCANTYNLISNDYLDGACCISPANLSYIHITDGFFIIQFHCIRNGVNVTTAITPDIVPSYLDGYVSNDNPDKLVIDNEGVGNETLVEFGYVKNDGFTIPKGLISTENGMLYHDYNHMSKSIRKFDIPDMVFDIEDWDEDISFYAELLQENKRYRITHKSESFSWTKEMSSNGNLQILHSSYSDGNLIIGGYADGGIKFGETELDNLENSSCFLAKIALNGSVSTFQVFENVDTDSKLIFSEKSDGEIMISGKYKEDWIMVNEETIGMYGENGKFMAKVDLQNQINLLGDISGNDNVRLLDISYLPNNNGYLAAIFVSGEAPVKLFGETIYAEPGDNLVLLSINESGILNWIKSFSGNFVMNKFDITSDMDGSSIFVGLTFSDTINLAGEGFVLEANGNEDILLLSLKATSGALGWYKHYGSPQNENISKLFFDNGALFFGGELTFDDSTDVREIGNYFFSNITEASTKAYISYVENTIHKESQSSFNNSTTTLSISESKKIKSNE